MFKYVRGSIYLPLVLQADDIKLLKGYVYVTYVTNQDYKGYTVSVVVMGRVTMVIMPKKWTRGAQWRSISSASMT